MTKLLELCGVSVAFGGLKALDDVNFEVSSGELLGLIGPNGAGKTTCLRTIAGLCKAKTGRVHLDGVDVSGLPIHKRVQQGLGMTYQIVQPLRSMRVVDNVVLACCQSQQIGLWQAFLRTDRSKESAQAMRLLAKVGIEAYANRDMTGIPLGILKRLEVARAMALNPRLILLDEPLAGLNHVESHALASLIKSLPAEGLTVILIEHNLGEVIRICDRLVVLDAGKVLAQGAPQVVMKNPAVIQAYIGMEAEHA